MANLLVAFAVEVFHTQMVAWRLQTAQMWIMIAGALFNVALNTVLIPGYGMAGAAIATLASSVVVLILAGIVLLRSGFELHLAPMTKAGMLAIVTAFLGRETDWVLAYSPPAVRLLVLGAILAALYAGLAWLAGVVRARDTYKYFTRA